MDLEILAPSLGSKISLILLIIILGLFMIFLTHSFLVDIETKLDNIVSSCDNNGDHIVSFEESIRDSCIIDKNTFEILDMNNDNKIDSQDGTAAKKSNKLHVIDDAIGIQDDDSNESGPFHNFNKSNFTSTTDRLPCSTLTVSLKGPKLMFGVYTSPIPGTYQKTADVNGKPSWQLWLTTPFQPVYSIWYKDRWLIGKKKNLGTGIAWVRGTNNFKGPVDDGNNIWEYMSPQGWRTAKGDEIKVQCSGM